MKTKALAILFFILSLQVVSACPACEKQQPRITQGLTHGTGPESYLDWVIISVIIAITLLTLIYSLKYLIKPGEENADHIKQSILGNL